MSRTHPLTALAGLAAAVVLAACGSSSPNTSASNPASTHSMVKFAACIRAHGVPNFPDPTQSAGAIRIQATQGPNGRTMSINGVPVNAPAFQAAQKKCAAYAPQSQSLSGVNVAAIRKNALAMAQCMRAHGVPNFPDPRIAVGPDGGGIGIQVGGPGVNPGSPAFQAAQSKCRPLMSGPLPGGRASGSAG